MEDFVQRVRQHSKHVVDAAPHCVSEETTKQALILPLLDILGYSAYDPRKVVAEYYSDVTGIKRGEKVDYALFNDGKPVMFIEAKAVSEKVTNHAAQLARYFNATPGVRLAIITNGKEWRFFTDLNNENVMDDEPFLTVEFPEISEGQIKELYRFRHGSIDGEVVRSIAEGMSYLSKCKEAVNSALQCLDSDFVRYIAGKAMPNLRLTQRVLDTFTPLTKRAVRECMVEMVAGGLNVQTPVVAKETSCAPQSEANTVSSPIIDQDNPNIVTTPDEMKLFQLVCRILHSKVQDGQLQPKDTEGYYSVLFQGKTNRWVIRYNVNRKTPIATFPIEFTPAHMREIERSGLEMASGNVVLESPEDILRIPGILFDSLEYVSDDENFRRKAGKQEEDTE